jgi:hypothetical protein
VLVPVGDGVGVAGSIAVGVGDGVGEDGAAVGAADGVGDGAATFHPPLEAPPRTRHREDEEEEGKRSEYTENEHREQQQQGDEPQEDPLRVWLDKLERNGFEHECEDFEEKGEEEGSSSRLGTVAFLQLRSRSVGGGRGTQVPQESLLEVALRSKFFIDQLDWNKLYPQLALSQTPGLRLGVHERGTFTELRQLQVNGNNGVGASAGGLPPALKALRHSFVWWLELRYAIDELWKMWSVEYELVGEGYRQAVELRCIDLGYEVL